MALEVHIDRDACIGSGNCAFWAPSTFDLDDEGKSIVIDPTGDDDDAIRNAADGCPTNAITIEDPNAQGDSRP